MKDTLRELIRNGDLICGKLMVFVVILLVSSHSFGLPALSQLGSEQWESILEILTILLSLACDTFPLLVPLTDPRTHWCIVARVVAGGAAKQTLILFATRQVVPSC